MRKIAAVLKDPEAAFRPLTETLEDGGGPATVRDVP